MLAYGMRLGGTYAFHLTPNAYRPLHPVAGSTYRPCFSGFAKYINLNSRKRSQASDLAFCQNSGSLLELHSLLPIFPEMAIHDHEKPQVRAISAILYGPLLKFT